VLEAAESDLYDLLSFDNLAPMIATLFEKYREQIHSAR